MRRLLLAVGLLLVAAPAAYAGGWATVSLSSTPAGTAPGAPWNVNITVLQHGRTPLSDLNPSVTISSGDATKTFAATPTSKPGMYRAEVVFPTAGEWSYEVNDGFLPPAHTYPAVEIGGTPAPAAAAATSDDGGPNLLWLVPGIALLLAAAALALRTRGRHDHQPQAA
jgi:hypothetical protein